MLSSTMALARLYIRNIVDRLHVCVIQGSYDTNDMADQVGLKG